jgi:predicted nucleotidyltransferase
MSIRSVGCRSDGLTKRTYHPAPARTPPVACDGMQAMSEGGDERTEDTTYEQIEALIRGLRDVIGNDLVGAYLHGSGVLGGFRPESDIDVLAVSTRRTLVDEKGRLIDLLLALSGGRGSSAPGRPIELDVVVASEIRPWRYPPTFDFHYSELWRERFERGDMEPWPSDTNPDLASAIKMVLVGDRPLAGPRPADVFDPVPRADYLDAILRDTRTVDEYLPWDTRNVVLTLPRIWSAIATDTVHSKESAATWALGRLPGEHRPVLELALAGYRGEVRDRWDDIHPETRAYTDRVLSEIERARADTDPVG